MSFMMGLIAWSALVLAPVVVVGPPLAAAFLLLALALTACVTLRFSLLAGGSTAAAGASLFATALTLLQAPGQTTMDLAAAARSASLSAVALPALLAAVGLGGTVAFAELVALGLECDRSRGETAQPSGPARRVRLVRRR
jgi:hypothetical protein